MSEPTHPEANDLSARGAALALVGIIAGLAIVLAAVAALLAGRGGILDPPVRRAMVPGPRLESDPRSGRIAVERRAQAALQGGNGNVSIAQAMRATVTAGWGRQP